MNQPPKTQPGNLIDLLDAEDKPQPQIQPQTINK